MTATSAGPVVSDRSPEISGSVGHGSEHRLHFVIGAVIAAGVAAELFALAAHPGWHGAPSLWKLVLTAALVAVGDTVVFHLRFGSENYTLTWSETAIILGLAITPWPWVSLVAPVGIIVAQTAARRAPQKVAFNAACTAASSALAAACASAITGTTDVRSAGTVTAALALSLAAATYFVANSLCVSAVIAAVRQMPVRQVIVEGLTLKLCLLGGNTLVALLLLSTPWRGTVVVLIPTNLILLFFSYRGYYRATLQGDVWRQLDAAAKELTVLDGAEVAQAAVSRAVHLFNADFAELVSHRDGTNAAQIFRFDGRSQLATVRPAGGDSMADEPPRASTTVEAPLTVAADADAKTIGVLRLGMKDGGRMSQQQHRVLRTFAHSVASSLQNARLYSEMRYRAELSAYEAARDALTGIANRKVLHSELDAALSRAAACGDTVALLLVDLDHFKEINDTLGHHTGDAVLCAVASRLSGAASSNALVARLGGDEFAILLQESDADRAETEAQRYLATLAQPVLYDGYHLVVGGSIGLACFPEDGSNSEDLLRRADMALYQAKQIRGAVSRYRSDLDDHSVSKITLAGELRRAIDTGQIVFLYQPQVSLVSGHLVGAEALARWCHPTRGMLPPIEFIDVVERSGLMHDFTLTALNSAVAQAAEWHRKRLTIPVSVNLSVRNLLDPSLPGDVQAILESYGVDPELLIIELTETTMVSDVEAMEGVLTRLRSIGVQLSVDDFGTGYSSLAFLQRIAVNEIKIDRSFVRLIPESENDTAIVRATIDLAHGLGIRVVAEGVEADGHATVLRDMGCDVGQGWHYGKPVPGDQLLRAWHRRAVGGFTIPTSVSMESAV